MRLNLAILVSGRGSNLKSIAHACQETDYPARIAIVISNHPSVPALSIARTFGIDTHCVDSAEYGTRVAHEHALHDALRPHTPDLLCLAGYDRLLTEEFIASYQGRIINIHPSLLPAYKGLDVHRRVIAAGESSSGCSVHYVVKEMDGGDVIDHISVPVAQDDTPERLAARILEQEHILYPRVIRALSHTWGQPHGHQQEHATPVGKTS